MDLAQKGILTLVKSAITGEKHSLPEGFCLDAVDEIIDKHEILSLIYYGASNCLGPSNKTVVKLFSECCKGIFVSEGQEFALNEICDAFNKGGIDYMPLKGALLKKMYPSPEMRRMGDADILIREEQYDKIKDILVGLGYEFQYETDHEIVWKSHSLELELHKKLVPERDIEFYSYFKSGWDFAKSDSNNPYLYTLSTEMQFVYLFVHMAKHYRSGGIGITHMVDLWIYRNHHPEIHETSVIEALDKLYLGEFYKNIMQTLNVWFEDAAPTEITDFITDVIFDNGVWGTHQAKILSLEAKRQERNPKSSQSLAVKILNLIFPSSKSLMTKHPILRKSVVFLPAVWIVRWFDILLFRRGRIKAKASDVQYLSQENLSAFEKGLKFVGLEYHFKGE